MASDEDIYSAMIGGAPTTPERQAALAQTLRQQAQMGQLFQLSGDRVLGPFGQNLQRTAEAGAGQIAGERERERTAEMMERYRFAQEQNMMDKILASRDIAAGKNLTAEDVARLRLAGVLGSAEIRTTGKPAKPIPATQLKSLQEASEAMIGVKQAMDNYQPGYGGSGRNIENYLAQKVPGVTPEKWQEAQNYWAMYGRQFTLPELKAQIGLRHNQYMQGVFESYHIDPNMNDQQNMQNLRQIYGMTYGRVSRAVKELSGQGYDITGFEDFLAPQPRSPTPTELSKQAIPKAVPQGEPTVPTFPTPGLNPNAVPSRAAPGGIDLKTKALPTGLDILNLIQQQNRETRAPPIGALGPQPTGVAQSIGGRGPSILEQALALQDQGVPVQAQGNLYQGLG